jgi:hypothetical protein
LHEIIRNMWPASRSTIRTQRIRPTGLNPDMSNQREKYRNSRHDCEHFSGEGRKLGHNERSPQRALRRHPILLGQRTHQYAWEKTPSITSAPLRVAIIKTIHKWGVARGLRFPRLDCRASPLAFVASFSGPLGYGWSEDDGVGEIDIYPAPVELTGGQWILHPQWAAIVRRQARSVPQCLRSCNRLPLRGGGAELVLARRRRQRPDSRTAIM